METFSIVDKINVDKLNTKVAEFVYRDLFLFCAIDARPFIALGRTG